MIIGLTGYAGAGKDEAANALTAQGWRRFSFADAVRELLLEINPIIGEHDDGGDRVQLGDADDRAGDGGGDRRPRCDCADPVHGRLGDQAGWRSAGSALRRCAAPGAEASSAPRRGSAREWNDFAHRATGPHRSGGNGVSCGLQAVPPTWLRARSTGGLQRRVRTAGRERPLKSRLHPRWRERARNQRWHPIVPSSLRTLSDQNGRP